MAKKGRKPSSRQDAVPAPRFGIGEWYGYSFARLTHGQRREFASLVKRQTRSAAPLCPFKPGDTPQICTKAGGICSLRLYEWAGDGSARPVDSEEGDLRAVCPYRFKQNGYVFGQIAKLALNTDQPKIVDEVRFLQRPSRARLGTTAEEAAEEARGDDVEASKEDVGNIDSVLVDPADASRWCALEMQAVYFSGEKMSDLFKHIAEFPDDRLPFPDKVRRPDYRSSGPKRLMPQLQIKVPTLRRWGKKMAVVVDQSFFRTNMIEVATVKHLSNADIVWFIVRFDESTNPATMVLGELKYQTLERAIESLTGGHPVDLEQFEAKVAEKLNAKPKKPTQKTLLTIETMTDHGQ